MNDSLIMKRHKAFERVFEESFRVLEYQVPSNQLQKMTIQILVDEY